jgi:hypothetical protein
VHDISGWLKIIGVHGMRGNICMSGKSSSIGDGMRRIHGLGKHPIDGCTCTRDELPTRPAKPYRGSIISIQLQLYELPYRYK